MFVQQKIRSIAILKCLGATTRQVLADLRPAGGAARPGRQRCSASRSRRLAIAADPGVADGGARRHCRYGADARRRCCRGSASACWCRCCSRSCRCSRSGASSRCCSFAASTRCRARPRGGAAARSARGGGDRLDAGRRPRPSRRRWSRVAAGRRRRCASGSWSAIGFAGRRAGAAPGRRRRWSARCAPLARARWFPLRHAVLSLRRPGNQTRVILLAVGLGSFFVLGVRALQANLLARVLARSCGAAAPTCS